MEKELKSGGIIWCEEDEINLLQGMVEYPSDPYQDLGKFFDFVKPFINFDVKKKQVTDKLSRFKNKFIQNRFNVCDPHQAKLYRIAKNIPSWIYYANDSKSISADSRPAEADDIENEKLEITTGSEKKGKKRVRGSIENEIEKDILNVYPRLSGSFETNMAGRVSKELVREVISSLGKEKAEEWEDEMAGLHLMEIELNAKKAWLNHKMMKLVLDGIHK